MSVVGNPLPGTEVRRYSATLRRLLASLDPEIVHTALVGEAQPDLLGAVGQEVDCFCEFLDRRVGVALVLDGLGGRSLAVLDAFQDELSPALHDSSPSSGVATSTVGEPSADPLPPEVAAPSGAAPGCRSARTPDPILRPDG